MNMNKEQALQEIKSRLKALFSSEGVESVEVKMYRCMTVDGKTLETDGEMLEVGAQIYNIDEDGNRTPVEDGTYVTEDYSIMVKDNMVESIVVPEETEDVIENPAEPVEAETKMMVTPNEGETKDEFVSRCIAAEIGNGYEQDQAAAMCYVKWDESMGSDYKDKKDEKMAELENKLTEMSKMIETLTETTIELNEKLINLSKQPAIAPVVMEKNLTPMELRTERLKQLALGK
jgi:hypothetical protein